MLWLVRRGFDTKRYSVLRQGKVLENINEFWKQYMNVLILNASPKSRGSASAFYSSLLRLFLTAQAAPLTVQTIFSCYSSMLVTLVMSLGAVICLAVMGHRIKRGTCRRNLFTRCLVPAFLFIPVSDIFMLLSALARGNLPHTRFRRRECPAQEKGTHL